MYPAGRFQALTDLHDGDASNLRTELRGLTVYGIVDVRGHPDRPAGAWRLAARVAREAVRSPHPSPSHPGAGHRGAVAAYARIEQ